jgi:hypothetical protein
VSGRWRSLGEAYAAVAYGRDQKRTNIEIATWTRRLAWEAGAFERLSVPLPELGDRASDVARIAKDGFSLLVGLRWSDGPQRPVAYSVRFCAAWCGLKHSEAWTGIAELVELCVIYVAETKGRMPLYLHGGGR